MDVRKMFCELSEKYEFSPEDVDKIEEACGEFERKEERISEISKKYRERFNSYSPPETEVKKEPEVEKHTPGDYSRFFIKGEK